MMCMIIAGLMGLVITLVCVLIYYRMHGLVANLALVVNLILLIGALTMFRFVLTLPGIAGIILTIGLSVDANVLIYERLREEMALGKSLRVAMETAYQKAFSSIFDANVTTLITAMILFWQATGPVRGFALSLKPFGLADASIQESAQAGKNYITVRSPLNTSDKVEKQITQTMPAAGFKVERSERVGALVGGELAKSSLVALGLGILGVLIFVTFRFELSFAVGAIVALFHDVIITVGLFSLLGRELTLTMVGAVLPIPGYSISEAIVFYDRIRERLA